MQIKFEHGTLVIYTQSDFRWPQQILLELHKQFNILWDPRIKKFRAPASQRKLLLDFLKSQGYKPSENSQNNFNKQEHLRNWKSLELRDYQHEAFHQWSLKGERGVVVLPTGAGKTRLALFCMKAKAVPTLILVPTRVLLHQWAEVLQSFFLGKIGLMGDSNKQIENITIATYESAKNWMAKIGDRFEFLIIDEVHHFLGDRNREAIDMCSASIFLGLSATFSGDKEQLLESQKYLGPVAFRLSLEDLRGKVLAEFQHLTLQVNLSSEERFIYERNMQSYKSCLNELTNNGDNGFNNKELFQLMTKSSKGKRALKALYQARATVARCKNKVLALNYLIQRFAEKKIIIFTADTEMAIKIAKTLLLMPITAKTSLSERKNIIKLFIEGKLGAIVTCRVLNEGFDVPNADMAIILGGALGTKEHIQRIGRILRPAENKVALIYEVICNNTFEVTQSKRRNEFQYETK
jgi:superfamily II DNA or RNA helicase